MSYAEAENHIGVEHPSLRLTKERLRWNCHALRSEDKVLSEVLTFVPEDGRQGRGLPGLRLSDTIKSDLNSRNIFNDAKRQEDFGFSLATRAADRVRWRAEILNITSLH